MFTEPTTPQPLQLDIVAVDLALILDDTGAEFVILRMVDATGMILDVPIARDQAESFGESLRAYAADAREPAWLI